MKRKMTTNNLILKCPDLDRLDHHLGGRHDVDAGARPGRPGRQVARQPLQEVQRRYLHQCLHPRSKGVEGIGTPQSK